MIPADLDHLVGDFAGLVGLILTLITLFTGTRDTNVRTLEDATLTNTSKAQLKTEILLCTGLVAVTLALFAAGIPLWVRTVENWSWSSDHSLRWVFVIVWVLLLPLAFWQGHIAVRAYKKRNP